MFNPTNHRIISATEHTIVVATDDPDPKAGGACHKYEVRDREDGTVLVLLRDAELRFRRLPAEHVFRAYRVSGSPGVQEHVSMRIAEPATRELDGSSEEP